MICNENGSAKIWIGVSNEVLEEAEYFVCLRSAITKMDGVKRKQKQN